MENEGVEMKRRWYLCNNIYFSFMHR